MAPSIVFIVPYRNRAQHRIFFMNYINIILEDYENDTYEIYFAHQIDDRPFNRGAMKNIGFLAIKDKYPNNYKNITFVFNDVDTLPYTKNILEYSTTKNVIKHFYGYTTALGGIVSILGQDFEKMNGFPNFWAWGREDNALQTRALLHRININRENFFKIGHPNILQLYDGLRKTIIKDQISRSNNINYRDGLNTITNLQYNIVRDDIQIQNFTVPINYMKEDYNAYNIFNGNKTNLMNSIMNSR